MAWLVLALATIGLACNGDDDAPADGGTPADASPTATQPPVVDGDVKSLAAAYLAGVDGKVTYTLTTVNWGSHPNGDLLVYHQGELERIDFVRTDELAVGTIVIINGENSYICTLAGALSSCESTVEANARSASIIYSTPIGELPDALVRGVSSVTTSALPAESIAGVDAQCFQISSSARIGDGLPGTDEAKACFAEDGTLLLLKRTAKFNDPTLPDATFDVVARAVEPAVATDFEPTAPVN